jgi:hypothetical protein
MNTLQDILNDETYKQVLRDSYGGVMYMTSPGDYESSDLIEIWLGLPNVEKERANGITNGVINFLKGN